MTSPSEITVTGIRYWADHPEQLAQLLATSSAIVIRDPTGEPVQPDQIAVLTHSDLWSQNPHELRDALAYAVGENAAPVRRSGSAPAAVAPVEQRLVFTVEEAAQLLGIRRSFAYEAVRRGDVPSMRIGRRILVPKAALLRILDGALEGGNGER
jgi:excisionase family DNA binding protein